MNPKSHKNIFWKPQLITLLIVCLCLLPWISRLNKPCCRSYRPTIFRLIFFSRNNIFYKISIYEILKKVEFFEIISPRISRNFEYNLYEFLARNCFQIESDLFQASLSLVIFFRLKCFFVDAFGLSWRCFCACITCGPLKV